MTRTRDELHRLLQLLDVTAPQEIDCTQLLHRVAAFVESLGPDDEVPPPGYEDVVQHLKVCPECLEEFEALVGVVGG